MVQKERLAGPGLQSGTDPETFRSNDRWPREPWQLLGFWKIPQTAKLTRQQLSSLLLTSMGNESHYLRAVDLFAQTTDDAGDEIVELGEAWDDRPPSRGCHCSGDRFGQERYDWCDPKPCKSFGFREPVGGEVDAEPACVGRQNCRGVLSSRPVMGEGETMFPAVGFDEQRKLS